MHDVAAAMHRAPSQRRATDTFDVVWQLLRLVIESGPLMDSRHAHLCVGIRALARWPGADGHNPDLSLSHVAQVIKALNGLVQSDSESDKGKEIANLMYETALLTSGFDVTSPKSYASRIYGLMGLALSKDDSESDSGAAPSGPAGKGASVEADQVIEEK